jgi:hypothetical protein
VLLSAVEVCALSPTQHGEDALRLSSATALGLFNSFIRFAGPDAVGRVGGPETDWVDLSPNPLYHPELQDLAKPVLRNLVGRLVPLLLPECHDIPLPGSQAADPTRSCLSAMLPQQVFMMAAAGVQCC